jgi:phage tail sheath protein FI
MPVTPTYPGVYVEEIPSGVRTITGVATSIVAFIGRARRGPTNEPVTINSFGDFERAFGGLQEEYLMSYAVRDFFLNGGSQAIIVRLVHPNYATDDDKTNAITTGAGVTSTKARNAANIVAKAVTAIVATNVAATDIKAAKDAAAAAETIIQGGPDTAGEHAAATKVKKAVDTVAIDGATLDAVKKAAQAAIPEVIPGKALLSLQTEAVRPATNGVPAINGVPLVIEAANEGEWGEKLGAHVDYEGLEAVGTRYAPLTKDDLFNLTIRNLGTGVMERFLNVAVKNGSRQVDRVLENESNLVRVHGVLPGTRPKDTDKLLSEPLQEAIKKGKVEGATEAEKKAGEDAAELIKAFDMPFKPADESRYITVVDEVDDGGPLDRNDITARPGLQANKRGLYALDKADLFNLLCIPSDKRGKDVDNEIIGIYQDVLPYCHARRAMLIVDSPASWSANKETAAARAKTGLPSLNLVGEQARNAMLFFPRVIQADPQREGQLEIFAPCGIVAGVIARTDATRGVWKAPAGLDATLNGIRGLEVNLNDAENGILNPLGINCLRFFPGAGAVVWGARTLRGSDQLADDYKYIPVRRTALYLEESLYRGLKWVVFEPNDEPLWAQIRLNVGAFMHNLFRQGAFQGKTPREAYFVKCDKETTTQNDINLGIVNIVVGFAPLKPAEFVFIKIQQIAGSIET